MKIRYRYIMLPIVLVALLAAMCTTASAGDYGSGCPYVNFYSGTLENGGGIYFDVKGHYDSAGATQSYTFENVPDGRQVVRMYPGIWLGSPSPGRVTEWSIEINGHVDYFNFTEPALPFCNMDCPPVDSTGEHCTVSCTGCGACSVTYNASPYIVTGDNGVTYWTDEQIYQVGLLAVYENESMEKLQYWVKEGQEYPDTAPYHVYFNETVNSGPIDTGNISAVEYYTYGYPHCPGESGWPNLNGNYIGSPNITKNNQYANVLYGWTEIPPAYIDAPDNCFLYPTLGNDRMMVPVLGIHYSGGPSPDTAAPYTDGHDPAKGATDVPPDTNIVVHVRDDGTGVNQSTIVMTVEGETVAPVITGTPADYTVTYDPSANFDCGLVVDVTVDAADLSETPNVMTTDSYSFTIVEAATPFMIYGWVNDSEGAILNDPDVNVTNLNTSEIYEVETNASFNYYQVLTCSDNVSTGDVLHFTAIGETTKEFNYIVEMDDMNRGGFEQNLTIEAIPYPDLVITEINAYHYNTGCMPWFNMSNEVDVTVKNTGDVNATGAFNVSVSIDGGYYAKQNVPGGLNVGESVTLTFSGWKPIGEDCFVNCACTDTCHNYTITGVADCDNDVEERYEENNATTISGEDGRACYNGYMADEPLENVAHGILRGRLNFTTGNGTYDGLYSVDDSKATEYEITIPAGASLKLAKLNVYYTWHYDTYCPQMEVSITNETGPHVLDLETSYNDMKCQCPGASWRLPWGNYVYDVTDYITGSGTYIVKVTRTGGEKVSIAAPGIMYVYEDENEPTIEYWINEGADVLIGGRRADGGYLAWWECINNATFPAGTGTGEVANATLGVVTPWGDSVPDDILSFNEIELGRGVYSGYSNTVDETLNGMSMYIGSTNAQIGVNMTDVKAQYVHESENMVSQADDGDNTMSCNAFLVVEYKEEKDDVANADAPVSGTVTGSYPDTHASDDVYESITEVLSTGNPAKNQYSYLEHKWTVDVTGGSEVTFYLEAYHSSSSDGDDFVFAYSTDDSTYTDMVTVTNTSDTNTYQTYGLPGDLSGTVYIRVMDTDQAAGNQDLDAIHIDHLFIRSVLAPSSYGVTATIDEASQTVSPGNSTTYTVWVKNTGDLDASYSVVMSGTAVDEATIDVSPLSWNTGTLAPNAENVQTVTVSTAAGTSETTYTLTAAATCDQDASVTDSVTSDLVVSSAEYTDDKANGDIPVTGTVSGSYLDTQASDDVYESITEVESGGKPANRYSHLEHKWTVDVTGGSDVTFYLEAHHSPSSDGDDFVFAYSTDDSTYIDMATVTKIADDGSYQTFDLPSTLSGTVYIRVKDTDQTAGNKAPDTIYIDHLFIRSGSAPPSYGVTVTIDEASQTVSPGNGTTYTVRVKNTGDLDASYSAVMTGTAVDEFTIDVSPLNWNTGTLAPNAENVTTVTVSTTASTPETTYTLTAAATCDQDASVTDSATSDLVVSSVTNAMHVASINMSLKTAGPNTNAIALVTIVDAAGAPVEGATVEGNWSGATTDTDSGETDASGEVSLDSDKLKSPPSGTVFTFTVDAVSLAGWAYDYAANVETSDSITVP